jgi:hypothetical protein
MMVDQDSGMEERHCHHAWAQGSGLMAAILTMGGLGWLGWVEM